MINTFNLLTQLVAHGISSKQEIFDLVNWDRISLRTDLPIEFIREFACHIQWDAFPIADYLTLEFVREFREKINWELLSSLPLPETIIIEQSSQIRWNLLFETRSLPERLLDTLIGICRIAEYEAMYIQELSEEFIRRHMDVLNLEFLCKTQKLSERFMREFANVLPFDVISIHQELEESFMREFSHVLDFEYISIYQMFSDDFLWEFSNRLDFFQLSRFKVLPESFIYKFADQLDIGIMSIHQDLSEGCMSYFADHIYWDPLCEMRDLSSDFIRRHRDRIVMTTRIQESIKRDHAMTTLKLQLPIEIAQIIGSYM